MEIEEIKPLSNDQVNLRQNGSLSSESLEDESECEDAE